MKKNYVVAMLITLTSFSAFSANANEELMKKLISMNGKTGEIKTNISNYPTQSCTIIVSQEENSTMVTLENGQEWPARIFLTSDAKMLSNDSVLSSETGERPGGDACGDYGGSIGYKKTITVSDDAVEIRESMRCLFDFGMKTDQRIKCVIK